MKTGNLRIFGIGFFLASSVCVLLSGCATQHVTQAEIDALQYIVDQNQTDLAPWEKAKKEPAK